jgi:hypothetical protein
MEIISGGFFSRHKCEERRMARALTVNDECESCERVKIHRKALTSIS